jgi:hypothetical protein
MLPNNSLASDTPTVHDPTLAVPLQHFNVGNTVPIETILQSTVTTTLVNQEIEIIDIKQEDAQRTPTTNAIEQQMLESLVHSEHEKNFNEVNNDKVQDDTMFLTIKQAWDLYQFLSVDQVQLFAQTLSQSQKEFFRLYKEQASLESVADDMVTDDVANEANDNTVNNLPQQQLIFREPAYSLQTTTQHSCPMNNMNSLATSKNSTQMFI